MNKVRTMIVQVMRLRLECDAHIRIIQRWLPCKLSSRMPREVKLLGEFDYVDVTLGPVLWRIIARMRITDGRNVVTRSWLR